MKTNIEKTNSGGFGFRIVGNERGSALLMTLGVLLLMLVIGLGFMFSALVEREVAAANAEAGKAKFYAESANARGLGILDSKFKCLDAKNSFSPLLAANSSGKLFPASGTASNTGYYVYPESDVFDSTGNKVGSIKVEIINRTGKLDPNWFGRPSHYFKKTVAGYDTILGTADDSKWWLEQLTGVLSMSDTPLGMSGTPDSGSNNVLFPNNALFVASPELRSVLSPTPNLTTRWSDAELAAIVPKNQVWVSRDQIFKEAAWDITNYDLVGNISFNQDLLFPNSPGALSLALNPSKPTQPPEPAPWLGGSNTFIDWPAGGWRNPASLPAVLPSDDSFFKMRVPFLWFANLDFTDAATGGDVKFATTSTFPCLDGTTPQPDLYFAGAKLADKMPWFKVVKAQRTADIASYYELAANFKDYVDADSAATSNVVLGGTGATIASPSTATLSFATPPASGIFCGNEAVPAISEIRLTGDSTLGIKTVEVEIVDFYLQNAVAKHDLVNLAAVVEVEWATTVGGATKYVQKFITGFANTSTPLIPGQTVASPGLTATPSVHKQLYVPTIPPTTTNMAVSKVRAYLIYYTGIGSMISMDSTTTLAGKIGNSVLYDVAVLDIPQSDQIPQTLGGGATSVKGKIVKNDIKTSGNNAIPVGKLFVSKVDSNIYVSLIGTMTINTTPNVGVNCAKVDPVPQWVDPPPPGVYTVSPVPSSTTNKGYLFAPSSAPNSDIYVRTGPSAWFPVGKVTDVAGTDLISFEVLDPRHNTRWSHKFQGTLYPQWSAKVGTDATVGSMGTVNSVWGDRLVIDPLGSQSTKGKMPNDTTPPYTTEDLPAPGFPTGTDASTVIPSTAYVRNGSVNPLITIPNQVPRSLWELGAIHRAEPWRTVKLVGGSWAPDGDYANGDWMLLDEVSLTQNDNWPSSYSPSIANGYITENGKANPNPDVLNASGLTQLCRNLTSIRASVGDTSPATAYAGIGNPTLCFLLSGTPPIVNTTAFVSDPILSRGEFALKTIGTWNPYGATTDAGGRTVADLDRNQEEIVGKFANLLQTRYQYFEILATGKSYHGTVDVPNPPPLSIHKIRSIVERDAYTGTMRVISTEHLDQ